MKPAFYTSLARRNTSRLSPLFTLLVGAGAAPTLAAPVVQPAAPQVGLQSTTSPRPAPAPVLISELRTFGPGGAQDTFVELFNNTSKPLSLAGWSLRFRDEKDAPTVVTMAPGTRIAARGHLLFTGRTYSLQALAAGDARLDSAIRGGIQLRDARGKLIDAVGPMGAASAEREGAGLPAFAFALAPPKPGAKVTTPQSSILRRALDGQPQDTDDNARDFALVSVSGVLSAQKIAIGTPGPEGSRNSPLRPLAIQLASFNAGAAPATAAFPASFKAAAPWLQPVLLQVDPERTAMRRARREVGPLKTFGTMTLRFRLTNDSGKPIKSLSFRVNSITSDPDIKTAPAADADLRLIRGKAPSPTDPAPTDAPSEDATSAATPGASAAPRRTLSVWKAKLATAPTQPQGGALNALLQVELPPSGIAPGARGEVVFSFGVERIGNYRIALGNQHMNLLFEGNTEDDLTITNAAAPEIASRPGGQRSGNSMTRGGAGNGVGGQTANADGTAPAPPDNLGAEEADGIILEGNTEDGVIVPPVVPPSSKSS